LNPSNRTSSATTTGTPFASVEEPGTLENTLTGPTAYLETTGSNLAETTEVVPAGSPERPSRRPFGSWHRPHMTIQPHRIDEFDALTRHLFDAATRLLEAINEDGPIPSVGVIEELHEIETFTTTAHAVGTLIRVSDAVTHTLPTATTVELSIHEHEGFEGAVLPKRVLDATGGVLWELEGEGLEDGFLDEVAFHLIGLNPAWGPWLTDETSEDDIDDIWGASSPGCRLGFRI